MKSEKVELYDKPVCDFCSGKPRWRYPAKTFVVEDKIEPRQVSEGDWLACDECAALIERKDKEALAHRGLKTPMAEMALGIMGKSDALKQIRILHDGFWKNRSGRVWLEGDPK